MPKAPKMVGRALGIHCYECSTLDEGRITLLYKEEEERK